MKKLFIVVLVLIAVMQTACEKSAVASGVPGCIKKNIEDNKNEPSWYTNKVEEYRFQGRLVYAFEPDTRIIADASTTILTDDCSQLCDVGAYGGPDVNLCNGENFFQNAVSVRVIWQKP